MSRRIGITGSNGFLGFHVYQNLKLLHSEYELIEFDRSYFLNDSLLDAFVAKCDVIIHLAGINRNENQQELYHTNIRLTNSLIQSLERTGALPHIIMSSSTQEDSNNPYGNSKKESREIFSKWANRKGALFSGLVIPNIFGPFALPNYNSVIATFSYQLVNNIEPEILVDKNLELIYVQDLVEIIINLIQKSDNTHNLLVNHSIKKSVKEILRLLSIYKRDYFLNYKIPSLTSNFEIQLFNTFRSYISLNDYYPKHLTIHNDERGFFVEVIKNNTSGQTSFSKTLQGVTRGNHFHTRKIERFAVIQGKAKIELRKVGFNKIFSFELDGNTPSFVDMPVWYTHNITNIGDEELLTVFWINEPYDPDDSDTYFEIV